MFGGPAGVQPSRERFRESAPRRKEYFESLGLVSSRLERLEASTLDSKYALVKVVWRMRFERGFIQPVTAIRTKGHREFLCVRRKHYHCRIRDSKLAPSVRLFP